MDEKIRVKISGLPFIWYFDSSVSEISNFSIHFFIFFSTGVCAPLLAAPLGGCQGCAPQSPPLDTRKIALEKFGQNFCTILDWVQISRHKLKSSFFDDRTFCDLTWQAYWYRIGDILVITIIIGRQHSSSLLMTFKYFIRDIDISGILSVKI